MIPIMLMLGVALALFAFDFGGTDIGEEPEPEPDNDVVDTDAVSGDILTGAGNDTVTGEAAAGSIFTGLGSDQIDVTTANSSVDGGGGDDQISAGGGDATLLGGDGNDTISAETAGMRAEGGGGDDDITLAPFGPVAGDEPPDRGSEVLGGAGDDTIRVTYDLDDRLRYDDAASLSGGDGADLFDLNIHATDTTEEIGTGLYGTPNVATIEDFEPGTDRLLIDIAGGSTHYELGQVSLQERTLHAGPFTEVRLFFTPVEGADSSLANQAVTIWLMGATGLTMDDLDIPGYTHTPLATDGDDQIDANMAAGDLHAGAGDDTVTGYAGSDVFGDGGNDSLDVDGYHVSVNGGAGDDTLVADGSGPVYINGDEGNDTLILTGTHASEPSGAHGGAGDDVLEITAGTDDFGVLSTSRVWGGSGADTFNIEMYAQAPDPYGPAPGPALFIEDFETGSDRITLDLASGLGNFEVTGVSISETAAGDSEIIVGYGAGTTGVAPFTGVIHLAGVTGLTLADLDIIESAGTPGDDSIVADTFVGDLHAGAGNDTITGTTTYDVYGDGDDDFIDISGYHVNAYGGDGNDTLEAGGSAVSINGDDGNDTLILKGTHGTEPAGAHGGAGDDVLEIYAGSDNQGVYGTSNVWGGSGADLFDIEMHAQPHDLYDDRPGPALQIGDFEPGVDRITLDLATGLGNYEIIDVSIAETGYGSSQIIVGYGPGTTGVAPFTGVILLSDVTGLSLADIDIIGYTPTTTPGDGSIDAGQATGVLHTGESNDTVFGFAGDDVYGDGGDDYIDVTGQSIAAYGGEGNDTLRAGRSGPGSVTIHGGDGDDTLVMYSHSGFWSNSAHGGAGDDVLDLTVYSDSFVTHGSPEVSGGSGADIFNVELFPSSPTPGTESDDEIALTIDDFEPGTDTLVLDLATGQGPYTIEDVTITEDTAGGFSEIVVTYGYYNYDLAADDTFTMTTRLTGVSGLALADLDITGWSPSAAA